MQYIQISRKIRIQRPGMEHLESERPFDRDANGEPKVDARGEIAFTDLDTPTVIDIDDTCEADVVTMLRIHAIKEVPAPKRKAAAKKTETEGGD